MKPKQVLSVEQMKHLQELGLDTSDGSMCFEWNESNADNMVVTSPDADTNYDYYHETYTLQDILGKLPCFIDTYVLTLQQLASTGTCLYMEPYSRSILILKEDKKLIDAAYEMLCWCIENKYIEKEK